MISLPHDLLKPSPVEISVGNYLGPAVYPYNMTGLPLQHDWSTPTTRPVYPYNTTPGNPYYH